MRLYKHTRRMVLLVLLLIMTAVFCRNINLFFPSAPYINFAADLLRSLIYISLLAAWGMSVSHRIIKTQVRRLLRSIAGLMLFWMMVRSLKYLFFSDTHIGRYCWYLYYLPMLFIPLLVLFAALSLGRPEHFRLKKWGNSLFIVSAVFLLLIVTNDFHQLAFRFHKGLLCYNNSDYHYGVIYYLALAWIAICASTAFGFIIARSHVPDSKKRILLPGIFLMLLIIYAVLYVINPDVIHSLAGDLTVVICLLVTAALESCIQSGLIQSNTHYNELFRICGISAVIVDNNYNIRCATPSAAALSPDQMTAAANHPLKLNEETILASMPLDEGHILWLEDVSELHHLRSKLEANAVLLAEEAELLSEEIRQKKEKAVTDVRNHLYDTVTQEIAPQIARINQLISNRPDDPDKRRKTLKEMCILGAYIKRRCNLIFLNEQQQVISSMELYNCLQESAEYIIQYGIPCSADHISSGNIPIESAKTAYDFFEAVIENALDTLTACSVRILASENVLTLHFMAECADIELITADLSHRIKSAGGLTEEDYEDGVWYCTLTLPEGGAALCLNA